MKNTFSLLVCSMMIFGSAAAMAETDPVKVPEIFNKIYIPIGFDSNDHIQVVGEGIHQTSCFRNAEAQVHVDQQNMRIELDPQAYQYNGICLQVLVPFTKIVDIGILKTGKWEVVQGANRGPSAILNVRQATTDNADDYLYAPISQAFYSQSKAGRQVILTGEFSNNCMTLTSVKTDIQPDVIVLQPISEMATRANCAAGHFPFSRTVNISTAKPGRYLLHVRSLNGNAVNSLIDVK